MFSTSYGGETWTLTTKDRLKITAAKIEFIKTD